VIAFVDLDRESDVEQLRRIARMQQLQIEKLLKILAAQSKRIDALVGSPGELQQMLALMDKIEPSAGSSDDSSTQNEAPSGGPPRKKKRTKFGSTSQPSLPVVEETFELDEPDRTCPQCGNELRPMTDQFDVSEWSTWSRSAIASCKPSSRSTRAAAAAASRRRRVPPTQSCLHVLRFDRIERVM
jgi:hypothetical protein